MNLKDALLRPVMLPVLFSAGALAPVSAATPPPLEGFNYEVMTVGTITTMLTLHDGSVIIGGDFSQVDRQPRGYIAKLDPEGQLDPDWRPMLDDVPYAMTQDPNGDVIVGGNFLTANGVERRRLVRLQSTGSGALVEGWNPAADSAVRALLLKNGRLYIGGAFTAVDGLPRSRLARLDAASGELDANFSIAVGGPVTAMTADGDGLYVGGTFFDIAGHPTQGIGRISLGAQGGVVDAEWAATVSPTVIDIVIAPDTTIYTSGTYSVSRLTSDGQRHPDWSEVHMRSNRLLASQGYLYVSGVPADPGFSGRGVVRFDLETTSLDEDWGVAVGPHTIVMTEAAEAGKLLIGGRFQRVGGIERLALAELGADGSPTSFSREVETVGTVNDIWSLPEGGFVVGGIFRRVGDHVTSNVARLSPDLRVDEGFSAGGFSEGANYRVAEVVSVAADAEGRVYAGGSFDRVGEVDKSNLVRLDTAGAADPEWRPPTEYWYIDDLAVVPDGSLWIAGLFQYPEGLPQDFECLARLETAATGDLETTWRRLCGDGLAIRLVPLPDGVLTLGSFARIELQPHHLMAKLDAAGTPMANFQTDFSSIPGVGYALAAAADEAGDFYVSGERYVGGPPNQVVNSPWLKRVRFDGSLDLDWNPALTLISSFATAVAIDDEGGVIVGGRNMADLARVERAGNGLQDPRWYPAPFGWSIKALAAVDGGRVLVGGHFLRVGGERAASLALLPVLSDHIFVSGMELD